MCALLQSCKVGDLALCAPQTGRACFALALASNLVTWHLCWALHPVRWCSNPAEEFTGGGFVSSSQDLAYWAWRLYNGTAQSTPYLQDLNRLYPSYKYSYEYDTWGGSVALNYSDIAEVPFNGFGYGHSGIFPGYRSIVLYLEKYGLSLSLQINSSDQAFQSMIELVESVSRRRNKISRGNLMVLQ